VVAELRVHFDEHRHVVGHDFPGDDFSPVFFSGLSNHRGKRFATGPTSTLRRYWGVHPQ
jgi:hypothetical protein